MDIISVDQFLVLGLFMAVLGGLWLLVHRNKQGLSQKLNRGKRLQLRESISLGGQAQAALLSVDGRDFLLVHGKAGTAALHPLGETQAPCEAAQ